VTNAATIAPQSEAGQAYFGRDLEAMSFAGNYYRWMLEIFRPYMGSAILEVGAGSGNFTDYLLEGKPHRLVSLEPSANMYPLLAERVAHQPHVETHKNYLSEVAPALTNSLDTAFYVNVLEHVENDRQELELALGTLKPGGHLLIFVPAMPFLFGTADENFGHFRRYTKASLTSLFSTLPATVVDCRYFDMLGMLPWWMSFVLLRQQSLSPGMVKLYDRLVVPIAKRLESIIQPPAGKNLLLVARKRC